METSLSATELVRRLGDVLARVRYRRETFVVRRNGRPVARIIPADESRAVPAREVLIGWHAASERDLALADDLDRIGRTDLPAGDPWLS
jgi:prevent-host-death family protein